jgi:AraC-like DNA-binding protein
MDRIFLGNVLAPTSITEFVEFNKDRPYTLSIKKFMEDDITIPHYAKSFEIILCDNLVGEAIIDTKHYPFKGRQVFVIPPGCVHSTIVKECDGLMYVLKISLDDLECFVNIENILIHIETSLDISDYELDIYPQLEKVIEQLINNDEDILLRFSEILAVFHLILPCFLKKADADKIKNKNQSQIKDLIDWSEEHLSRRITLQDAAEHVGYNKYYFCHWFKELSGITYNEYLIRIRIQKACKLLLEDKSVSEVTRLCGYENTSYFIRQFNKYRKCTPKVYYKRYKS